MPIFFLLLFLLPTLIFSQQKVALVVGANHYDLLAPLQAAVNDSEKVSLGPRPNKTEELDKKLNEELKKALQEYTALQAVSK